jgi:hypothetical protein
MFYFNLERAIRENTRNRTNRKRVYLFVGLVDGVRGEPIPVPRDARTATNLLSILAWIQGGGVKK